MSISLKKHNTGTYRQTTEKITNLSTKRVTLEEKIQIFERFSKTGEELLGNTKFDIIIREELLEKVDKDY